MGSGGAASGSSAVQMITDLVALTKLPQELPEQFPVLHPNFSSLVLKKQIPNLWDL